MAKFRRSGKSRTDRHRTRRTTAVHTRYILDILCQVAVIYTVFQFATAKRKIDQAIESIERVSRSAFSATVNGLANISYVLYTTGQLVSGFVSFVFELGQWPGFWILNVWQFLKWALDILATAFVFVEESIPLSKTGEVIILFLAMGITKLIRTNAALAKAEKILKSNLEEREAELKVKKKQESGQVKQHNATVKEMTTLKLEISILEKQNNALQSKVEELCQRTKALYKDKMQLKSQKESNMKKAEKQNEEFAAETQKLKLQTKEVNLKLKKAEKQNQMFEEKTSKVKAQNHDLKLKVEQEKDEKLCIICVDNYRNILLQPCNHFCLCKDCMQYKKWAKCPLCRQHIQSTIDIYV